MPPILHLRKQLDSKPQIQAVEGVALRHFAGDQDVPGWLELRRRAFAQVTPPVGEWTAASFQREFFAQSWWHPERMWMAENLPSVRERDNFQSRLIGAVTLAERRGPQGEAPTLHWLLVDPDYRRQGVGRLLVQMAERAVWDAGQRTVALETHAGWTAAVAFYRALGYQ